MHVEKEAIYTIRKRALRIQARLDFLALGLSLPLLMLMWDQLLPNSLLTPVHSFPSASPCGLSQTAMEALLPIL